jgi:hypothetical protein
MADARIRPSIEAMMMTQEIGSLATPTPIATMDSPRAMMTIKPCRSEKWPGAGSRHPEKPPSAVPT